MHAYDRASANDDQPRPRATLLWCVTYGAVGLLLLWLPLLCVLWPSRPYVADLLAMTAAYPLLLYLPVGAIAWLVHRKMAAWHILMAFLVTAGCLTYLNLPIGNPAVVPQMARASAPGSAPPRRVTFVSFNLHGDADTDQDKFATWCLSKDAQVISVMGPTDSTLLYRRLVTERGFQRAEWYNEHLYVDGHARMRSPWTERQPGDFDLPGGIVLFITDLRMGERLHVLPGGFASPRTPDDWRFALGRAAQVGRACAWLDMNLAPPVVACHDNNSTMVGQVYRDFALCSGLCDAMATNAPHGSWPAGLPTWASLPIDHIWISRKLRLVDSGVGPDMGTLHRPVWATVELPQVEP